MVKKVHKKGLIKLIISIIILIIGLILLISFLFQYLQYENINVIHDQIGKKEIEERREINGETYYVKGKISEERKEHYGDYNYIYKIDDVGDIRTKESIGSEGDYVYLKLDYHIEGYCGIDEYWDVQDIKNNTDIYFPIIISVIITIIGCIFSYIVYKKNLYIIQPI